MKLNEPLRRFPHSPEGRINDGPKDDFETPLAYYRVSCDEHGQTGNGMTLKQWYCAAPIFPALIHLALATLAYVALLAPVQASAIAGHDYEVLAVPRSQESSGKIEVIEFFSWACPHCYEFSPLLNQWLAKRPKDVTFRRIPVGFGHPEWESLVKAFYALQATGDVARLDSAIFDAIHKDHVSLFTEASITAWVGKHGVDVATFTAAFHSFSMDLNVSESEQSVINYRVSGVPTLAIAGRYTVSDEFPKMLATADELIVKARELNKKANK
jgi:thiol:disulfide interchange protein DsbA